jgi:NADPH:quinone reductase-like Zn-dependent oxidoreductase
VRQIWIPRRGEPEVLELREAADPLPKAGEVRIRVSASGVNFADIMARMGLYPDLPPLPVVVGYEAAGRVDAVGWRSPASVPTPTWSAFPSSKCSRGRR